MIPMANSEAAIPKAYLAGFEVFRPDAAEEGRRLKALCSEYGFQGIFPLDKDIKPLPSRSATAQAIFEGNVRLVRQADLIIANLNPFRGQEPDAGTVFECGLAYALGKPLYAHLLDARTMEDKLREDTDSDTGLYRDGMSIEAFGLPVNLMLGVPAAIAEGTLEDALKLAAADFRSQAASSQ